MISTRNIDLQLVVIYRWICKDPIGEVPGLTRVWWHFKKSRLFLQSLDHHQVRAAERNRLPLTTVSGSLGAVKLFNLFPSVDRANQIFFSLNLSAFPFLCDLLIFCFDFFFRRLFLSPVHRELYVCHQDGVAQDILDLAFHLAFGAVL